MSTNIISQLNELQKPSNKNITSTVIARIQSRSKPRALAKSVMIANADWEMVPIDGSSSLLNPRNRQSLRKVKTLTSDRGQTIYDLNTALLGGRDYPILTAVIGTASGLASMGVGLFFTAATTGLSLSKTSQRILARTGDEIWHLEEIGKVRDGSTYKAVYVSSFIIVDPYRYKALDKGWLFHEERHDLSL